MATSVRRGSWRDIEARRRALPVPLSRAELARRAGVSDSTITKGLRHDRAPQQRVREMVDLVLDAAQAMAEAGL